MHTTNLFRVIFPLICLAAVYGCTPGSPRNGDLPLDDVAVRAAELIRSANPEPFREAFTTWMQYEFSRSITYEQLDKAQTPIASRSYTVDYRWENGVPEAVIESRESTGEFSLGLLGRFSDEGPITLPSHDLVAALLPDQPVFLTPRGYEAYSYDVNETTDSMVIEIRLSPAFEGDHPVTYARYVIEQETSVLRSVQIIRRSETFLFREDTETFGAILRQPEGSYFADSTFVETHIRVPLIGMSRFRSASRFSDFRPRSS